MGRFRALYMGHGRLRAAKRPTRPQHCATCHPGTSVDPCPIAPAARPWVWAQRGAIAAHRKAIAAHHGAIAARRGLIAPGVTRP